MTRDAESLDVGDRVATALRERLDVVQVEVCLAKCCPALVAEAAPGAR